MQHVTKLVSANLKPGDRFYRAGGALGKDDIRIRVALADVVTEGEFLIDIR